MALSESGFYKKKCIDGNVLTKICRMKRSIDERLGMEINAWKEIRRYGKKSIDGNALPVICQRKERQWEYSQWKKKEKS